MINILRRNRPRRLRKADPTALERFVCWRRVWCSPQAPQPPSASAPARRRIVRIIFVQPRRQLAQMLRERQRRDRSRRGRAGLFPRLCHLDRVTNRSAARNQSASNGRRRISASARNKEKCQSDRDQIFAGSDEEVLDVQIIH